MKNGFEKNENKIEEVSSVFSANDARLGDRPLKLITDLDVDDRDNVYFLDGSHRCDRNSKAQSLMEDFPSGRYNII